MEQISIINLFLKISNYYRLNQLKQSKKEKKNSLDDVAAAEAQLQHSSLLWLLQTLSFSQRNSNLLTGPSFCTSLRKNNLIPKCLVFL